MEHFTAHFLLVKYSDMKLVGKLHFAKNCKILLIFEEVRLLRKSILTQYTHESLKVILIVWLPWLSTFKSLFSIKILIFTTRQFFVLLTIYLGPAVLLNLGILGVKDGRSPCLSVCNTNCRSLYAWNDTFVYSLI